MTALGDKARGSKANSELGGSRGGKANRWNSGPPPHSRQSKSPQASDMATKGSPAAANSRSSSATSGGAMTGTFGGRTKSQDKALHTGVPSLIEGEVPEQVEAMHNRLLFLLSYLVGSQVKVTTKSGTNYTGVLTSLNPNDAHSAVLRYAYSLDGGKAAPPIDTLVIHGDDCLSISGIASFADGGDKESLRTGFKTDTDISKTGGVASARELHRWMPDESDALGSLESGLDRPTSSGKGWDQFATNEQLFGLTTDFDEEIYTTRLDRTRADYKSREREAIRIAHEIQNTPFLNSHVGEERQEVADDDDAGMDEEDRYGAVLRPTGAPGKYVPPYLRGKTEASPPVKQRAADSSMAPEPTPRAPAPPAAGVQDDLAAAGSAAMRSNNAKAAAALAKLNIRMTSHSPAAEPTRQPLAKAALPPSAASGGGSPGLAADPAITALSKQPSASTSSKLANLRGLKHRSDVAALNKPMADITEKLNSERERIHLHKQALLKDRMSDLVKFHKSFKLNTPMPEDVAEIIRARKKSPVQSVGLGASSNSGETTSDSGKASSSSNTVPAPPNTCKMASASPEPVVLPEKPTAALSESEGALSILSHEEVAATSDKAAVVTPEAKINPNEAVESVAATANATATAITSDSSADLKGPAAEPKQGDKKTSFKFNAKASLFKPSAAASPFVPKLSAPSSRASSSAGVSEFNPFFGRRVLKRAPVSLWGDIFKTTEHRPDSDDAPIWPFGVRTYRSQFVPDETEAMMYQPQGYVPQYGYGYYQMPYQYPPQVSMLPPGVAPRMPTSLPYTAAASAYGSSGVGSGYAGGPYNAPLGYPSPIMVAGDGRSPIISAINGSGMPTTHPLSHSQSGMAASGGSTCDAQVVGTPEMGAGMLPGQATHAQQAPSHHPHMARSGSDSPNVMYGMPPVHMGVVPPPMAYNGMQAGGYMGPPPPPLPSLAHQGYPPQSMAVPMGYAPYMAGQQYAASPPNMVVMHGTPHLDQGAPSGHPGGGYQG